MVLFIAGYCCQFWCCFHILCLVVRKPGVPTRSHTNQAVQLQKMARGLKFRIIKLRRIALRGSSNKF